VASALVEVRHLSVVFGRGPTAARPVRDVSVDIGDETLALVGESGCGKTTLALALLGLLDHRARVESGEARFQGLDLLRAAPERLREIRGKEIGVVFQHPRGSLNPVLTAEEHTIETLRAHERMGRRAARARARELLGEVGLHDGTTRRYPFELSGGMCQRLAIALALCHRPKLLVADEPTSALDPTIAREVLALLVQLRRRTSLSVLLISHDLRLVAGFADRVAIMYHGRLVEVGPAHESLSAPAHPYTRALVESSPGFEHRHDGRRLASIAGSPPRAEQEFSGCSFAPRCPALEPRCTAARPEPVAVSESRSAACFRLAP